MITKKHKCTSCEADYILKYEEEELYPIQCPFCGFEYEESELEEQVETNDDEEDNWN